jgi:hypothetical protein
VPKISNEFISNASPAQFAIKINQLQRGSRIIENRKLNEPAVGFEPTTC